MTVKEFGAQAVHVGRHDWSGEYECVAHPLRVVALPQFDASPTAGPGVRQLSDVLHGCGFATLVVDLQSSEDQIDVALLSQRLVDVLGWLHDRHAGMEVGVFGTRFVASAALRAVADRPGIAAAVVSRSASPELLGARSRSCAGTHAADRRRRRRAAASVPPRSAARADLREAARGGARRGPVVRRTRCARDRGAPGRGLVHADTWPPAGCNERRRRRATGQPTHRSGPARHGPPWSRRRAATRTAPAPIGARPTPWHSTARACTRCSRAKAVPAWMRCPALARASPRRSERC